LSYSHEGDWLDSTVRIVPQSVSPSNLVRELPPLDAVKINFSFASKTRQDLIFTPALADRSIVTRLESPLVIFPRETVHLFIVSALRLRIELPDSATLIQEIAIHRPSDTWLGPTNSSGELAYANDAAVFLDLAHVPLRLHCAVTAIAIRNSRTTALRIDRICVPFKKLSLFYSARSGFWTDAVLFDHKDDNSIADHLAIMQLTKQPPAEASPCQFVLGPRDASAESRLVRAFGTSSNEWNSQ